MPEDDGAAAHLEGAALPDVPLAATTGGMLSLPQTGQGEGQTLPPSPPTGEGLTLTRLVAYVYPRTGRPGEPSPPGWDAIPGARGCTPQSCAFRDHAGELAARGAHVVGISAQTADEQREFAEREHIPYPLLADPELRLAAALGLPTFEAGGMTLYRRLTFVARGGVVEKVFYPVFPPDRNAAEVLAWLGQNPVA